MADTGSEMGDVDAGLHIETGALEGIAAPDEVEVLGNEALVLLSGLLARTGEDFL